MDPSLPGDLAAKLANARSKDSTSAKLEFLKEYAKSQYTGGPEIVMGFGMDLLSNSGELEKLENFDCLEEFFQAAVELGLMDWSDLALKLIQKHAFSSPKSLRYLAMQLEAKGELQKAKNLYREIIT